MAGLPQRGPNERETLANEIRALVKERALSPTAAARVAGETPQRVSLLLSGKLYSFTERQLTKIRDRLDGTAKP
jgi:predicted XRE-type DNA-binding protein